MPRKEEPSESVYYRFQVKKAPEPRTMCDGGTAPKIDEEVMKKLLRAQLSKYQEPLYESKPSYRSTTSTTRQRATKPSTTSKATNPKTKKKSRWSWLKRKDG
jgi:hypothetical protein